MFKAFKLYLIILKQEVYKNIYDTGYKNGVKDSLNEVANIVHDAKYPEYLEEDLVEYLNDKGVKV